jgi:hypothetical protein
MDEKVQQLKIHNLIGDGKTNGTDFMDNFLIL